jgi:hypothetical protein
MGDYVRGTMKVKVTNENGKAVADYPVILILDRESEGNTFTFTSDSDYTRAMIDIADLAWT